MPSFRTKEGRPFETGWVRSAGPLEYLNYHEGARQVLRFVLQMFCLESGAAGSDGWRVSKKTEFVHYQNENPSPQYCRQCLGIQGHRKLDEEDRAERETARQPCERRHHKAIQTFQIPMVGRNVWAIDQESKGDSLKDIRQSNPKLPTARDGDHWQRETLQQSPFDIPWNWRRRRTSVDPECVAVGTERALAR